jgi:hypothetical protein
VVPSVLIVIVSFHFVALNRDEIKVVECKFYILFTYLWLTEPTLPATQTVQHRMVWWRPIQWKSTSGNKGLPNPNFLYMWPLYLTRISVYVTVIPNTYFTVPSNPMGRPNRLVSHLISLEVGIATGYGLDDRGVAVRVPVGSRIFSCPRRPHRFWGPPNLLYNGYRRLFPWGVKRPGCEADHSSPTSAEVKKMWIYISTPPYAFMAYCLISQTQGQLYLYLICYHVFPAALSVPFSSLLMYQVYIYYKRSSVKN